MYIANTMKFHMQHPLNRVCIKEMTINYFMSPLTSGEQLKAPWASCFKNKNVFRFHPMHCWTKWTKLLKKCWKSYKVNIIFS